MRRRIFIGISIGGAISAAAGTAYLLSDKRNLLRADIKPENAQLDDLQPDEKEILFLASLAPSGHNTQPWFVIHLAPYHWIIGNDRSRWLPAVDPNQRETLLSIGAFLQNLEFASDALGYDCVWKLLATTNQDERVMELRLIKTESRNTANIERMKDRRTKRAGFSRETLRKEDIVHLTTGESEFAHYLPASARESGFIRDQTIEANHLQCERDAAQVELAEWIRFSSKDAREHRDGLTTGSMEIDGFAGWVVRNFYDQSSVMKKGFRERSLAQVREQVSHSAGWLLITSADASVAAMLETGRRMQRIFLKVRARGIGLHPMTQILEEDSTRSALRSALDIAANVQFILRVGYVATYPPPVSLRRPPSWFVRN